MPPWDLPWPKRHLPGRKALRKYQFQSLELTLKVLLTEGLRHGFQKQILSRHPKLPGEAISSLLSQLQCALQFRHPNTGLR